MSKTNPKDTKEKEVSPEEDTASTSEASNEEQADAGLSSDKDKETPKSSDVHSESEDLEGLDSDDSSVEDPLTELLQKLDEAEVRAQKAEDRAVRAIADLDNFRRRLHREKEDAIKRTTSSLLEGFLPVWDNFKMGLQAATKAENREAFLKGFEMVGDQFRSFLENNGIEEIDPEGLTFDPNLHECLSQQPSEDIEENRVITTIRVGFRIGQHLIRPASVIISSGCPEGSKNEQEDPAK